MSPAIWTTCRAQDGEHGERCQAAAQVSVQRAHITQCSMSLLGMRLPACRVLRETRGADFPAIVPEIDDRSFLTGIHIFIVEPDDPTAPRFLVR